MLGSYTVLQAMQARRTDAGRGCGASGYIGSVTLLETIARLVGLLRKQNPDLVYGAGC